MSTMSFDQILRAARQLTPQEQDELIAHLRSGNEPSPSERDELLRERIVAEFERRKAAGAFENAAILRNKYANPALDALTNEQLLADLRDAASEWEKELNELDNNDN